MENIEVGKAVFLKAVGNNARGRKEVFIREDVITKVGRKYFEVGEGRSLLKFFIESKKQESGEYIADWKLYFSRQEILDEGECEQLFWDIKSEFGGYGKPKFTLDQLRRIKEIISE
jgi:CRISPR/Cas system Type II protein with McrA/HNH and RuvC-like nuclease domain